MPAFEVSRTLVKSPPEVWAELEQVERLAALLSDDAIKITKTDPEKAIEWQGEGAHGRIEIEVSGWGTKVRLTTETADVAEPEPKPEPEPDPQPELEAEPEPTVAVEPEPESTPTPTFWAKVKAWFNPESAPEEIFEEPIEAATAEPETVPDTKPEPEAELAPEPVAEAAAEPQPEPTAEPIDYEQRMTALLDHLGSAHKRPFVNA